jgi:hypothetical protein
MPYYRVYVLDENSQLTAAVDFDCADDDGRAGQAVSRRRLGGRSLRDNDPSETAELRAEGLVDDNGLSPEGIEFVKAAFM